MGILPCLGSYGMVFEEVAHQCIISATLAGYKGVWLRPLLKDLDEIQVKKSIIYCNNRSAISIAHNPTLHGLTKHIDTRFTSYMIL